MSLIALEMIVIIDRLDSIELKCLCVAKKSVNRVKRNTIE